MSKRAKNIIPLKRLNTFEHVVEGVVIDNNRIKSPDELKSLAADLVEKLEVLEEQLYITNRVNKGTQVFEIIKILSQEFDLD